MLLRNAPVSTPPLGGIKGSCFIFFFTLTTIARLASSLIADVVPVHVAVINGNRSLLRDRSERRLETRS